MWDLLINLLTGMEPENKGVLPSEPVLLDVYSTRASIVVAIGDNGWKI